MKTRRSSVVGPRMNSTRFNHFTRRPNFELLEERRVLTTPAVGSFFRLDGEVSSLTYAYSEAWDGEAYDENPNSPIDPSEILNDPDMVRNAIPTRTATAGGATASGHAKVAGYIFPLSTATSSVAVPFVSIERVEIASANQGSGGAYAQVTSLKFLYQPL
jgi:hypothetical protein